MALTNKESQEMIKSMKSKILKGELAAVTESEVGLITSVNALSILISVGQYFSSIVKSDNISLNFGEVLNLIKMCCLELGLDKEFDEMKLTDECSSKILPYLNMIVYVFHRQKLYREILQLSPMIANLSPVVFTISDPDTAKMAQKACKEVASTIWISACTLSSKKEALQLFCNSLRLFSNQQQSDNKLLCNKLISAVEYCGIETDWQLKKGTLLQSLLKNVTFASKGKLDESVSDKLMTVVVLHMFKKVKAKGMQCVTSDLEALDKLSSISNSKLQVAISVFKVMSTFLSEADVQVIVEFRACLTASHRGFAGDLLMEMCNAVPQNDWNEFPLPAVLELLALVVDCLPSSPISRIVKRANFVVKLAHLEVPSEVQEEKWINHNLKSVQLVCDALRITCKKFQHTDEDILKTLLIDLSNYFHRVSFLAYQYVSSSCYFEFHLLLDVYAAKAFSMVPIFISKSIDVQEMLTCIQSVASQTCYVMLKPGDNMEEKASLTLLFSLLHITAVSECSSILPTTADFLHTAMSIWCDIKLKVNMLQLAGKQREMSIVSLWNKCKNIIFSRFAASVEEPNWEDILCIEINLYNEMVECVPLVVSAGRALESLKSKSEDLTQWARTTLALSHVKCQEGGDCCSDSVTLAATVVNRLEAELKKKPTDELLVYLIEANYQLYISDQKAQRTQSAKLAEIPLLVRAPPMRNDPAGESHAVEAWEEQQELSQLGQVLSCRNEGKCTSCLFDIINYSSQLLAKEKKYCDAVSITPALTALERIGYIFSAMGNSWMSMKCWGLLFALSKQVGNPKSQLIAVAMIISRYSLVSGSAEEKWILENSDILKENLSGDKEADFYFTLYDLCYARSLMISNKKEQAADILLRILKESTGTESKEVLIRASLLASQLMIALPHSSPNRQKLMQLECGPKEAALVAAAMSVNFVSGNRPAEKDSRNLRRQELMIDASIWAAQLETLTGCYRLACTTLQALLNKLQQLMLPTRVAQVLSCLGDLDLMTPDQQQLDQRLYWNEKILSLGSAIHETDAKTRATPRSHTVGTSPTRFRRKQFQLTESCSLRCSKDKNSGCGLCKNPLYQYCKVHYAFLVEDNEETFMKLVGQLEVSFGERVKRIWGHTWRYIVHSKTAEGEASHRGFLPLLLSPISALKCRQQLAMAALQAEEGNALAAAHATSDIISTLRTLQHETAPILLHWALAQLSTCLLQIRGIGCFSKTLVAPSQLPAPSVEDEDDDLMTVGSATAPKTPARPVAVPVPKRPGRGRPKLQTEPTLSPIIKSVKVPKLKLPDDVPAVSPVTKAKVLFSSDNTASPTQSMKVSIKKTNGKENKITEPLDSPPIHKVSERKPNRQNLTKNSGIGSPAIAPVCIEAKTPAKQYPGKKCTRNLKPTTKCASSKVNNVHQDNVSPSSDDSPIIHPPTSQRKKQMIIKSSPESPTSFVKTKKKYVVKKVKFLTNSDSKSSQSSDTCPEENSPTKADPVSKTTSKTVRRTYVRKIK